MNLRARWRIERPIRLDTVLSAAGRLLLILTVTIAVVSQWTGRERDADRISRLEQQLAGRNEIADCRSQLASNVSSEQTDYMLAQGGLIRELARNGDRQGALLTMFAEGQELAGARDLRVAFEEHPTGDCPL